MGEGTSRPGSDRIRSFLWWWLTYIYSGLGPLPPNVGGKGFHGGQFERGQVLHLIHVKGGLHLQSF